MRRLVVALLTVGLMAGCGRSSEERPGEGVKLDAVAAPAAKNATKSPAATPVTIFSANVSAYAATLALDEEAVYVLASDAVYRVVPGQEPEHWKLELGSAVALAGDSFVFWSDGALRRAPKRGGAPRALAPVPRQPQRVAASGERVVWLDHDGAGKFTVHSLEGAGSRVAYEPAGQVLNLSLQGEQVFFVEQLADASHRIVAVPLSGQEPRFTPKKAGRAPSMLAAAEGELFYYDGPSFTVRRLTSDLEGERVLGEDVICSPLAVAGGVYCAAPGQLSFLPLEGGAARALYTGRPGLITAIAASRTRVAWLVDGGAGRLAVETLPLTE